MALNQNNPPPKKQQFPSQPQPSWFARLLGHNNTSGNGVAFLCRQKSGPVFIKLGQWLSTRRDIIRSISVSKKWREGTHYAGTVQAGSEMEVKTEKNSRYQ